MTSVRSQDPSGTTGPSRCGQRRGQGTFTEVTKNLDLILTSMGSHWRDTGKSTGPSFPYLPLIVLLLGKKL